MALQRAHILCDISGTCGVTDSPPRHGVGLAESVDEDCPVLHVVYLGDGKVLHSVVGERLVNFVRDNPHVGMTAQHRCKLFYFFSAVNRAGRIVRHIQYQSAGFVRNRLFNQSDVQGKALLRFCLHNNGFCAADFYQLGIGQPIRAYDNDLVPLLTHGLQGVEKALLCARAYHYLFRLIIECIVSFKLCANRLFQGSDSACGSVFSQSLVESVLRRVHDKLGRVEVRFARGKADDVHSAFLELVGFRRDCQRQGRRNVFGTIGYIKHFLCPPKA